MANLPKPLRLLLLAIALSSPAVYATPASHIFARAAAKTCSAQDLISCPKALPENFCCPQKNTCIALADNTSALCCPAGQDCNFIQPITCDISKQRADGDPTAPIKTTVFDVDLETCSDGCCPFGYSCSANGLCSKDKDQTKPPGGTKPTASQTNTAAPTSTGSATSTATESTATTAAATASPTSSGAPAGDSDSGQKSGSSSPATTSIIGGVVGGCLVLLLIAVIIFLYIRRNNRRHASALEKGGHKRNGGTSGSSSFGNIISDPIIQPNSYRTDFILKTPSVHSNINNAPPIPASNPRGLYPRISIPNPFNSPNPSATSPTASNLSHEDEPMRTGRVAGARLAPIRAMKASSRHLRRLTASKAPREPSSENINVFADPTTVGSPVDDPRYARHTTFSDLMDEADLSEVKRGKPYVPGTTPRI